VHRIRLNRICATNSSFGKEPTITLEKVQYTARTHTTGGRDGASRSDDGRLDVKVSSTGTPGSGTNPAVNHSGTAKLVRPRRRMIMSAVSSAPTGRSFLATLAAAGAFGLILLAAPSYGQTVPAARAQGSVTSPLPAKQLAAAEDKAIRPFPYQYSGSGTRGHAPTREGDTVARQGDCP
jgi:hypothetical protein